MGVQLTKKENGRGRPDCGENQSALDMWHFEGFGDVYQAVVHESEAHVLVSGYRIRDHQ